jgi:hypothetical protein
VGAVQVAGSHAAILTNPAELTTRIFAACVRPAVCHK